MLVARKSHRHGHAALAIQDKRSLNHGRVALLRDRFVRSRMTFNTRLYSQCTASSVAAVIRAVWETARRICPAQAGRRPKGRASGNERVNDRRLKRWNELIRIRMRSNNPLPTVSALTESPVRADDSSPGSASLRAQPWVKTPKNPTANSEAARSAKFICGHPIRPIRPIAPHHPSTHPHPKSTLAHPKSTVDLGCEPLIKVENSLSPALYKPLIRPENKGIQSISNRHKPKNFITRSLRKVASGCYPLKSKNLIHRDFSVQGHSKPFKGFCMHHFLFLCANIEISVRRTHSPGGHYCILRNSTQTYANLRNTLPPAIWRIPFRHGTLHMGWGLPRRSPAHAGRRRVAATQSPPLYAFLPSTFLPKLCR
jgi:hypothetical protein